MNITLSTNTGLRKRLRRLFASKAAVVSVNLSKATIPQGIVRTVFETGTINYLPSVKPDEVYKMQQCLMKFGRKEPAKFRQLQLASQQNTFKTA